MTLHRGDLQIFGDLETESFSRGAVVTYCEWLDKEMVVKQLMKSWTFIPQLRIQRLLGLREVP